jgi:hypothetical protein
MRNTEERLAREAEGRRLEAITRKAEEKRLAKQKEVWDQRYRNTVTERFSNKFGKMLTYRPSRANSLFTRTERKGIPVNDTVYVNEHFVSQNGKLGYVASKGATKRFYNLINLDTGEERSRYRALLLKIANSEKRFTKGTIVKVTGLTGFGAPLNEKFGVVIDLYEYGNAKTILYRVQIKGDDNKVKAYPVKPDNLVKASEGTTLTKSYKPHSLR